MVLIVAVAGLALIPIIIKMARRGDRRKQVWVWWPPDNDSGPR
jgi:hypothetical protein